MGMKPGQLRFTEPKSEVRAPKPWNAYGEGTIWSSIANGQELVHGAVHGL